MMTMAMAEAKRDEPVLINLDLNSIFTLNVRCVHITIFHSHDGRNLFVDDYRPLQNNEKE